MSITLLVCSVRLHPFSIRVSGFNWNFCHSWRKSYRGPIWNWNRNRTRI